jgi:L-ascorbate metabolism protein UlaG (beta-lactamase superfamily)
VKRRHFLTTLGASAGLLSVGGCVGLRATTAGPGWKGPVTDHFDGKQFFNPRGPTGNTLGNLIRWQSSREQGAWPEKITNNATPRLPDNVGDGEAHVTLVNHCTFLIQLPGCNLLTDPVWSERVSPFSFAGPRRIRPPGIAWDTLPRIDAVLISHSHFDHLDLPTLRELHARFKPHFITGLGNRAFLEGQGFGKVQELDWWGTASIPDLGARIAFTPAQHWTARSFAERNTTLWGGFWIETARRRIYFAGDSGYSPDFADIRARLGPPDLALLPIGAYEPRWFMKGAHLAPDDALVAHRDLGARASLGMHCDTFPLADEAFGDAERLLAEAREKSGVTSAQFRAPATGETVIIG